MTGRLHRFLSTAAAVVVLPLASATAQGGAAAPSGAFRSNDPLLDQIWAGSVRTAEAMLAPGGQSVDALGRPCSTPAGRTVILDGVNRDRCPFVGDESVIDATFDSAIPHWDVQRSMLAFFAAMQQPTGAIPASPLNGGIVLPDYCGYWAMTLYEYVLYSGDVAFARAQWPALVRLLDEWYPAQAGADGLLRNDTYPDQDYAFLRRHGDVIAYLNAQYVYVLREAAQLAGWLARPAEERAWRLRAAAVSRAFQVFWDEGSGAFVDTTADRSTHPQDGNSFAILAGIATKKQAARALDHLTKYNGRSYGNSIADVPTYDDPTWGAQSNLRVYPFMSYYELQARFATHDDFRALDLLRREWGYMRHNGPGTDWETIGPYGGSPTDPHHGLSLAAGWSSGAAAALTRYVLGVVPTSPGYATYAVRPHPGDLTWASGRVVTPRGILDISWRRVASVTDPTTKKVVRRYRISSSFEK